MVIQSNVLRMILGWDIPFVYPNRECTPLVVSLKWIVKIGQCSTCLFVNLFVQMLLLPCEGFFPKKWVCKNPSRWL
jgi:hypothetical protein